MYEPSAPVSSVKSAPVLAREVHKLAVQTCDALGRIWIVSQDYRFVNIDFRLQLKTSPRASFHITPVFAEYCIRIGFQLSVIPTLKPLRFLFNERSSMNVKTALFQLFITAKLKYE